jgi:hypothetical protein
LPRIEPLRRHAVVPRQQYGLPPFPPVRKVAIRALIMRKKKKAKKGKGGQRQGVERPWLARPFFFCVRASRFYAFG